MLKRLAYYAVSIVYTVFSSYLFPGFLLIAFNYGKGIQNNEDGILCIPLGFVLVGLTVLLEVVLVRKALKMQQASRLEKVLVCVVLIAVLILSAILTAQTWRLFFRCFGHYKGLNLGLQH